MDSDDAAAAEPIEAARELLDALTDHERSLVSDAAKEKLAALEAALEKDAETRPQPAEEPAKEPAEEPAEESKEDDALVATGDVSTLAAGAAALTGAAALLGAGAARRKRR